MAGSWGLDVLYIASSVGLSLAGLTMVALASHAYGETDRVEMLHLAIGFSLVVAAAMATTVGAYFANFLNTATLLTVHNAVATLGYAFVIYSVLRR
ncbi:MAG: hypothetical protein ABEJ55_05275 [Halanaeroarchaeum sp.]